MFNFSIINVTQDKLTDISLEVITSLENHENSI